MSLVGDPEVGRRSSYRDQSPIATSRSHPPGVELFEVHYPGDKRFPPHVDRRFRISIVCNGRLRETHRGTEEEASTLSVVTKPGDARHTDHFGPAGAGVLSVVAPLSPLAAPERSTEKLRQWRWMHEGPVAVATTDRALAAVALDCGFCDQSHLTHVFREQLGTTPGAFRLLALRGLAEGTRWIRTRDEN